MTRSKKKFSEYSLAGQTWIVVIFIASLGLAQPGSATSSVALPSRCAAASCSGASPA